MQLTETEALQALIKIQTKIKATNVASNDYNILCTMRNDLRELLKRLWG